MRRSQALFCTVWRPLLGVSGKDRILLANPEISFSVAERSFSFLNRVKMFVKPMP